MSAKLESLFERVQSIRMPEPDSECEAAVCELANILTQLIEEVQSIDRVLRDHLKDVE